MHTGGNRYGDQAPWPATEPDRAWAVHLKDEAGRFRTVAIDLDGGRDDTLRDAQELCGLLDGAGIRYAIVRSGPTGGLHILATFRPHVPSQLVTALGELLRRRLPRLDPASLSASRTAALRPPGSLHRSGGFRSRILGDEEEAIEVLRVGNSPTLLLGLVDRLGGKSWRFEPALGGRTVSDTLRLCSPSTRDVITTGVVTPRPDNSNSVVLMSALVGFVNAGVTFGEAVRVPDDWSLAIHEVMRQQVEKTGKRRGDRLGHLYGEWRKAQAFVEARPPIGGPNDARLVLSDVAAASVDWEWRRAAGNRHWKVLMALVGIAMRVGNVEISCSVRQLAEEAKLGSNNKRVSDSLHQLIGQGWLVLVRKGRGTQANTYRLQVPNPYPLSTSQRGGAGCSGSAMGLVREALATDVFRWGGLPTSALRVLASLDVDERLTAADLQRSSGVSRSSVHRVLPRLERHGLAVRHPDHTWTRREQLDLGAVEEALGTTGAGERVRRIHAEERRWWKENLAVAAAQAAEGMVVDSVTGEIISLTVGDYWAEKAARREIVRGRAAAARVAPVRGEADEAPAVGGGVAVPEPGPRDGGGGSEDSGGRRSKLLGSYMGQEASCYGSRQQGPGPNSPPLGRSSTAGSGRCRP